MKKRLIKYLNRLMAFASPESIGSAVAFSIFSQLFVIFILIPLIFIFYGEFNKLFLTIEISNFYYKNSGLTSFFSSILSALFAIYFTKSK